MSSGDHRIRQRVLDDLPFGVWVGHAPSGEVIYTNQCFQSVIGVAAVTGAPIEAAPANYGIFDRFGNPYPVEKLAFSRAVASGAPVVVDDLVVHRRDGSQICVRVFANPVRDERGVVSHVVLALTDITAEVRAMVERGEIERHLEVAIHHAPVLLFMLDRTGVLTTADGALRPLLEADNYRMVGLSILDAYRDNPVVMANLRRALAGETVSYSVQVRGLSLDVWLGPVRNAAGEQTGAIGVATDVTEARRAQLRLIQEDRIRAMGTVAASVAHEINNPLTYVLANLDEAQLEIERLASELEALRHSQPRVAAALGRIEKLRRCLEPVAVGTRRIRDVTRELKTFTRPDDEQLTPINLACVVSSVLSLLRKEIEARARLVVEIGESPAVLANDARLVQVLTNLLMNAWQAVSGSEPAKQVIGVRTGSLEGDALIEIWDSGSGVEPQLRERIFEPFITTKDVGSGTGLGLFVCRNIINALHGRISVHDAPGGGALFRVTLPAMTGSATTPTPEPHATPTADARNHRRLVLIIDDDPQVASSLAQRLRVDPFEVQTVLDSRQGLALLLSDIDFDLVYCDVMMKDLTGIDLYEILRRQAPERLSKLVFMTGGAFTAEARTFLEQRGDGHVQKPFDILTDARRRAGLASA